MLRYIPLLLTAALCSPALADSITVLSETYHVTGSLVDKLAGTSTSYDHTSGSAVADELVAIPGLWETRSSAGPMFVMSAAGVGGDNEHGALASATADIVFLPNANLLELALAGQTAGFTTVTVTLTDLVTSAVLFHQTYNDLSVQPVLFSSADSLAIVGSHSHLLRLTSSSVGPDFSVAESGVAASLNVVPLPAAAWGGMALLGGLGITNRIRRRKDTSVDVA